jgi:Lrp/AsnC family transcriptional regulator, leucine-responsive regulatory protein
MDRKNGLDRLDRILLDLLQREGRITNVRLAAEVGLSQASALERVRKLEEQGYIERYVALVNPERVGRGTTAWALVGLSFHEGKSVEKFVRAIRTHPDVLECYHVAGEEDFLLKVVVPDIAAYRDFLLGLLAKDMGIAKVRTMMVLDVLKRETRVPLQEPAPAAPRRRTSRADRPI